MLPNIWSTFIRKFVTENSQKEPNLVTLYNIDHSGNFFTASSLFTSSGPSSCVIHESDLTEGLRVLIKLEGHFYPGQIQAISPPDIYGVLVDRERGNKPHIFSREEVLKEAVSSLERPFRMDRSENTSLRRRITVPPDLLFILLGFSCFAYG